VFTMRGGGHLADFVRDLQDDKVIAAVAPQVTATMTPQALVEAVMNAALELAF